MAGPSKRRAREQKPGASTSGDSSTASHGKTASSIPRVDGNRDPGAESDRRIPIDYSAPNSLKNISEALGLAGWYTARGVSANISYHFPYIPALPFPPEHIC
jgi:eukaryotic translation initiation factor 2C